jgi:PAS domain S-box-containing protein
MILDVRTMYIAMASTCFIVAAALSTTQREGTRQWALGWALQGAFWMLVGLRGIVWDFVSIVVGNSLLPASYSMIYAAVRQFQGRSYNRRMLLFPTAVTFIFFSYFSLYTENISYRIVFIALLSMLQTGALAWVLFREAPKLERRAYWLTGFAFVLAWLVWCNRLLEGLTLPYGQMSVLVATTFRNATVMATSVVAILSTMGFLLMIRGRAEHALQGSEQRYRSLFSGMTEGFALHEIICDERDEPSDYRFLEVNPAFERLTGLKRDDLLGKTVTYVIPGIEPYWIATYGKVALTGEPMHFENFSSALGKHYDVFAYSPAPRQFAAMFTDITMRKKAEQALRENEQRWATTLASIGDAVIAADTSGRIVFMNAVAEGLTGWALRDASMKPVTKVFNIINEETRSEVESPVAKVLREGTIVGLANHTILVKKDGTEAPIDDSAAPIKDKDGNTTGVVLVFRDITERKRAEEALRASEEKYRNLVKYAPAAIYEIDVQAMKYVSVNDVMCGILGYSREELLSMRATDLTDQEGVLLFKERMRKQFAGEALPATVEYRARKKNGQWIDTLINMGVSAYSDGKPSRVAIIAYDITERKAIENELRKSQRLLRDIIDSSPSAIFLKDRDGKFITINAPLEKMLGMTREELSGKTDYDIASKDMADYWRAHDEQVLKTGLPMQIEEAADLQDGHHVFLANKFPLVDASGQIYGVCAISHDITERKRAEEAVQTTLQRFYTVLSRMYGGLLLVTDEGRVEFANQAFCGYFDLNDSPEDLVGLTAVEVFAKIGKAYLHPDEAVAHVREIVDRGQPVKGEQVAMRGGRELLRDFIPIRIGGRSYGRLWYHTDITERKAMERALQKARDDLEQRVIERTEQLAASEKEFRLLAEAMPQIVWITRADGWNIYFNQQWVDYTGLTLEESYGHGWNKPFHPDDQKRAWDAWQNAVTNNGSYSLECRLRKADGTYRWWLIRGVPVIDEKGETTKWFGTCTDIEEFKRVEGQLRQAQKMEALGTLTGGVAHDFNNMLAAIIGFTELVVDHVPKESREAHHLKRVMESSLRGRDLVRQMLTFSRKAEQDKKPLSLSAIVEETVQLIRATTPTTISIKVDILKESGLILADPTQTQQVVMNLCTNAAHAMREKGGTLDIQVSDHAVSKSDGDPDGIKPGLYTRLTVRDTGTGISQEIVDKIFDPFFTTKKPGEGTGLGLSVVHGIVKQSNGHIAVESKEGKGSAFTVYFPQISGEPESASVGDDEIPTGSERILFVDDEEALVEMGEDILAELGYEVTSRMSSREALALFKADPSRFDLVITDQTMPEMTGVELVKEILALRAHMPIIMCTGFSYLVDADRAKAAGIRAFAMKPLTKREIARTIRKVLDE